MSELVQRLSESQHPVEITLRPEKSVKALKESIDRGYVNVRFTETRGGTELGVRLNPGLTDLSTADFEGETGRLRLVGDLTLDYVKVRCTADIELPALSGRGRLDRLAD
jgi:hypothetical protein